MSNDIEAMDMIFSILDSEIFLPHGGRFCKRLTNLIKNEVKRGGYDK